MRKLAALVILAAVSQINAQTTVTTSSVSFATPSRGANVIRTTGAPAATVTGYARVQPVASTTPTGMAIFDYRQNGVLVTEAAVPGTATLLVGRTFAELNGPINTGLAFANPNDVQVTVTFSFADQFGNVFGQNSFVLNPNTQIARFLDEAPFNVRSGFTGAISFAATTPVGVMALRTLVNERNEFLVTTQTVTAVPANFSSAALTMPHFADGGGWRTRLVLVNTTDQIVNGFVEFFDEGSAAAAATPVTINVNGQVAALFPYTIRARSATTLQTSGPTGAVRVGSIRVTPTGPASPPSAFAIFTFTNNGVTVSETTVQAQAPGVNFLSYVEVNRNPGQSGQTPEIEPIDTAIAIANNSLATATVNLELLALNGATTGLTSIVPVAGFGHLSRFMRELFPTMPDRFEGMLRITSFSSIVVMPLRTRTNTRGDFLITSTPASNEGSPSTTAELLFPHIVDGGGYRMQFVLFSGVLNQNTTGVLRFFAQNGQSLNLTIR
jgi:hypothetical protein